MMLETPAAAKLSGAAALANHLRFWWWRHIGRHLPHFPRLVWPDDEVDVTITFREAVLDQTDPLGSLFRGHLAEVERQLNEIGITFDKGVGLNDRDWEWDWSLSGPINVRFRSRAKHPERRR